jgi:flagellar biogenesis protein FliO
MEGTAYWVSTTIALLAICGLVIWLLRVLGRRSAPLAGLRVLARLPLEPRRSIYLVEAASRCFLVGVGEGAMSMLAELDPAQAKSSLPEAPGPRLGDALRRLLGVRS